MPITGKFVADFSSFMDAVNAAEVSLRSFETGASKVEKQLNRTADAFSGRKILSEAELAVRAVNDIGGATKLTESEQRKLNATLTEAIAKTKALGYEASKDMVALANATKQANTEVSKMPSALSGIKSTLTGIAGAFGVAFSIGAVVNFGKSVFDSASKIHDLSEQLGISSEAVQGFKFAAEQSGSSLDAVGTAITRMNRNLADGDKSTIASLKTAGLSFAQIRNLKPEDAFLAIADAIQKIPDPMTQSQVAIQLFGRSAAELLPGIKEGFRGVAESADKMSDDTINSLEAAQDAWEALGNRVTIITGNLIANTANAVKGMTGSLAKFASFVENSFRFGLGNAANIAGTTQAVEDQAAAAAKISKTAAEVGKLAAAHDKAASAAAGHTRAVEQTISMYDRLMHDASHDIDAVASKIEAMGEKFDGFDRELFDVTHEIIGLDDEIGKMGERLEDAFALEDAKVAAADIKAVADHINHMSGETEKARDYLHELSQAFAELSQISGGVFGQIIGDIAVLVRSLEVARDAVKDFKGGMSAFKDGDMLGGILGMASGILGIASAAIAAAKALNNLFDRNKGRDVVVDFAEMHGGFDALHNELLQLGAEGERLWIALTQGVGRNNPAQAQAAIDAINAALERHREVLNDASAAATQMGEAESEAVQQARAAIQALDDQIKGLQASIANEAPEEVMGVIEAQTRAEIARIQEQRDAAQRAFDETGAAAEEMAEKTSNAFKDKFTTAAQAAAEIMAGDIRHTLDAADFVARLRFEFEIPENIQVNATANVPGFAGGTHGQFLDFGAGTNVRLHGRERVMTEGERGGTQPIIFQTYLNSRVIAEETFPHFAEVADQYGVR